MSLSFSLKKEWQKQQKKESFNRIRNSNTASIYHCFLSFLEDFDLSFKHFYAFVGPWNPNKRGEEIMGFFSSVRHQRPRHLDQWSHGSLVQKCTAPVGGFCTSRWVASCAKNPEIPVAPKTQVALLHQFVKNSPTWNIWWEYWNLNVNSQAIIGERQDTKIRNPEPMLKDCTPPAALTLEKWHFGTSHLELTSCRSVGGWKTVNKSKLTSH